MRNDDMDIVGISNQEKMFETYITQITELQWSNDHVHMAYAEVMTFINNHYNARGKKRYTQPLEQQREKGKHF